MRNSNRKKREAFLDYFVEKLQSENLPIMKINYKVKNIIPLLQLNVEDIPKVVK